MTAEAQMSRPSKATGIVAAWTGVGVEKFIADKALRDGGMSGKYAKKGYWSRDMYRQFYGDGYSSYIMKTSAYYRS